jgi:hypothetical protein
MVRTGATFADAAAEYLRYIEQDRGRKPSTLRGYRSAIDAHLLPAFGELPVESVTTTVIEQWLAGFSGAQAARSRCSPRRRCARWSGRPGPNRTARCS